MNKMIIKKLACVAVFIFSFFHAEAQHTNILIGDKYFPEEPSIVINPKNTNCLVAGANSDNYYYSTDGGYNWTYGYLTSSLGYVWGDPCIIVDTSGNYYYFHLSNREMSTNPFYLDRIVCQKLDYIGSTWSDGTYMGFDSIKDQDKEWAVVDRRNNNIYVTWTQFDKYGSTVSTDSSIVLFSRSTDEGQSWSDAKRINKTAGDCLDDDNTVEGAVPTVGPNGEIYVSWTGPAGIVFDKSTDGGNTWLDKDIFVDSMPGGWNFSIPGISRCNGLPVIACDVSNGPYRGNIYINWSDQRNGFSDTDIWLRKSTDGGVTWSKAKRVNDDPPGKQQFFTWMTIDQTNGYLYFVFYDRRKYNNVNTAVYMAVSKDGGETFVNFKISENSFYPYSSVFFGDYTNITAHNNVIRPIWTSLHYGALSVWTAIIDSNFIGIDNAQPIPFSLEQNMPNPFNETTYLSFKLHETCNISLKVLDLYGREVASVIDNEKRSVGKYVEHFDASQYDIASGVYYFVLIVNDQRLVRKMVFQK